jgi:hypothetical protein
MQESNETFYKVLDLLPSRLLDLPTLDALLVTSHQTRSTILEILTPHSLFLIARQSRVYSDDWVSEKWYLLSLVARGFAPWLAESSVNRRAFRKASSTIPDGLLNLAADHPLVANRSGFSLEVLRQTVKRKGLMVGLSDLMDRCVGTQWREIPDFWEGGAEDAITLEGETEGAIWPLLVYGELFGRGLGGWLESLLTTEGQGIEALASSVSDELSKQKSSARFHPMSDASASHRAEPSVELALRCEYVKYAMIDRHVPLEWDRGARPWGIRTDWEYPASLLSDDNESAIEGGSTEAADPGTKRAEVQSDEEDNVSAWEDGGEIINRQHETDPNTRLPCVHQATNHPIRQVKLEGPYHRSRRLDLELEHSAVLIHLLKRSLLWARITKPIRHRAIGLAEAPQDPPRMPSAAVSLEVGAKDDTRIEPEGGEFGTTVASTKWWEEAGWKQQIWEDALWTSGWDGLEVIADAWEYSEENHKAIARRDARKVALAPCPQSFCAHQSTRRATEEAQEDTAAVPIGRSESTSFPCQTELDDRVADDHPAFQRLGAIYAQVDLLRDRPPGIEFRSILHPDRSEMYGSEGPLIVSDMGLMIWEPRWH